MLKADGVGKRLRSDKILSARVIAESRQRRLRGRDRRRKGRRKERQPPLLTPPTSTSTIATSPHPSPEPSRVARFYHPTPTLWTIDLYPRPPRQREHRRTSRRPVQGIRSRRVAVYIFWVVVGVLVFASRSAGQHSTHQTSASARLPLVKDLGSVKGRRNPTPPSALPRASAAALRTCRTRCCCGVKAALRTKPGWAGYPAISQGLSLSCFWL